MSGLLLTAYFVLPLNDLDSGKKLLRLIVILLAVVGLMMWQVYAISTSDHPTFRAVEAVVVTFPFYMLTYSAIYLAMSKSNPAAFSEPVSHVDALYFTVTTFATVGFGDITPTTSAARLIVTGQMLSNLILLGVGFRIIARAISIGRSRKSPRS